MSFIMCWILLMCLQSFQRSLCCSLVNCLFFIPIFVISIIRYFVLPQGRLFHLWNLFARHYILTFDCLINFVWFRNLLENWITWVLYAKKLKCRCGHMNKRQKMFLRSGGRVDSYHVQKYWLESLLLEMR